MRAYQLKIIVNDSKSPSYQKCRIPDGLTFSQFSVILNEIIGLKKADKFYFEFYKENSIISELEFSIDFAANNLEASTTLIHRFMKERENFYYHHYSYDLKENKNYEIKIERFLEHYHKTYPEVIEIGDYNINKMKKSSCHKLYCFSEKTEKTAAINKNLENRFKIMEERKDTRKQKEIYQDFEKGKVGLFIYNKKKNSSSKKEIPEYFTEQTPDILKIKEVYEVLEELKALSLKEIYGCYTKQDIIDIGKMHKLKGYSNYKKEELIDYTIDHLLKPETMQRFFLCLRDKEIKEFENTLESEGVCRIKDIRAFGRLLEAGYCGIHGLEIIDVPDDVKEVYKKINTREFHKKRKQRSFLIDCFFIAGALYGTAPISVILEIYYKKYKTKMQEAELIQEIKQVPEFLYDFVIQKNLFIHKSLLENNMYQYLQACQEDIGFYIPSIQEIETYAEYGYFADDKVIKELKYYFKEELKVPENMAEIAAALIQQEVGFGCQTQDIENILEEYQITFTDLKQEKKWRDFIKRLQVNTRMIINRGYKKEELTKRAKKKNMNIIEFKSWKEKKIYPNDPCPCGSKAKFKDCCGKRRKN